MEGIRELGEVISSLQSITASRPDIVACIEALKVNQLSCDDIDDEYYSERLLLEAKYATRKRNYYSRRKMIVNGELDVEVGENGALVEVSSGASEDVSSKDPVIVPHFWLLALGNHPATEQLLQADDVPLLALLEDIEISYNDDFSKFTLSFLFKENPYFHNKVLTKSYTLSDVFCADGPSLDNIEGCTIDWKEGKNLCVEKITKKRKIKKGKSKGQYKTETKYIQRRSFFRFFSKPRNENDSIDHQNVDEDVDVDHDNDKQVDGDDEESSLRLDLTEDEDYAIAHVIQWYIIPDTILWYTGEARDAGDESQEKITAAAAAAAASDGV